MRLFPPVLLSSVVLLSGCGLVGDGVDHRVYEGQAPEYGPLDSVSGVAWEWEPEYPHEYSAVRGGVAGPVLELDEGVVALDAESGEELWHYRAEGRSLNQAATTPDNESALLLFGNGDGEPADVVVLDTGSGELVSEFEVPDAYTFGSWQAGITDDALVLRGLRGVEAHGVSLQDGQELWSHEEWPVPEGFSGVPWGEPAVSVQGQVVVASHLFEERDPEDALYEEYGRFRVVTYARSAESGELLWDMETDFDVDAPEPPLEQELTKSGQSVLVEVPGAVDPDVEQFLVDVESGERFEGEAFEGGLTPDERVTLTDEGSVSADWLPDDDAVEYRHVSFEGDKLEEALVPARPSEMKSDPGVVLGDGVLRLSHLTVPDLDRGPVEAEFVEWGSEGEPAPIEVGLTENSDEWRQAEYEENRSVR